MRLATLRSGELAMVVDDTAVPIGGDSLSASPQSMTELIRSFDRLRPELEKLASQAPAGRDASLALDAPIRIPSKIWAAASNYYRGSFDIDQQQGRGEGQQKTEEEILEMTFLKPQSSIAGPGDTILIPKAAETVFPEVELCAVIGKECRDISPEAALDVVFGYSILIDVTARGYGAGSSGHGTRCVRKGFDTFAPLGPWIVTSDEIPDPQALSMRLWVNDELRQSAKTSAMINNVARLVSFLSQVCTLYPGDLISTGNPDSPRYQKKLHEGDEMRADIDSIGEMTLHVGKA